MINDTPLPVFHEDVPTLETDTLNPEVVKTERKYKYPDIGEYVDAKVKQQSNDPVMIADGLAQEKAYVAKCLDIKKQHPLV